MSKDNVVNFSITGDASDAQKEFNKLRKNMAKTIAKNKELENKTKSGAKSSSKEVKGLGDAFSMQAAKVGVMTAAIGIAYHEISKLIKKAEELKQLEHSSTLSFGDSFGRLQVQGNIKNGSADARKLENALFAISKKYGADINQVAAGATQFVSSGGTIGQISNGAFEQVVATGVATNSSDFRGLSKSMLSFERGSGANVSELSPSDMRKSGVRLVGGFGDNVAEAGDLDAMAKIITSLVNAGMSKDQAFAAVTAAKQSEGSADAAGMAIKQIVGKLRTGRGNASFENALKQMGLKSQDVDFSGEGLDEILGLLGDGLKKAKPEDRAVILKNIFGEEAAAKAESLIAKRGEIQSIASKLSDTEGFDSRVQIGSSSVNANERRIQNDRTRGTKTGGSVTRMQEREMYKNLVMKAMREGKITKLQGTQILGDLDDVQGSAFEALSDPQEWFQRVIATRLGSGLVGLISGDPIPEFNQPGYDSLALGAEDMVRDASRGVSPPSQMLDEMKKTNNHLDKLSKTTTRDSDFKTGNNPITKGQP